MKMSIDIRPEMHAEFKRMAEKKGITLSALIKLATKEYIEREENKKRESNSYQD